MVDSRRTICKLFRRRRWVTKLNHEYSLPPETVTETTEKIFQIKERLKTARSRQKSYADKRRKPLEFKVGDRVLLKVSPWKGVVRFGKKGKLAPRYVGPFEIVECVGPVAYRLKLPQELSCIHDMFHVSNLKKCLAELEVQVPLEEIEIDENLRFVEEPIEIVERDVKKLKRRRIPLVKFRWNSQQGAEVYFGRKKIQFRQVPASFRPPLVCSRQLNLGQSSLRGSAVGLRKFRSIGTDNPHLTVGSQVDHVHLHVENFIECWHDSLLLKGRQLSTNVAPVPYVVAFEQNEEWVNAMVDGSDPEMTDGCTCDFPCPLSTRVEEAAANPSRV
ncbi:hypothetical protein Tco_1156695 [Tanacetum coccineum]